MCLQELLDAEFIPMPDDSQDSMDPLTTSYTESATLPYEELDHLKAAAAATTATTEKSLMVSVACQTEHVLICRLYVTQRSLRDCQQSEMNV